MVEQEPGSGGKYRGSQTVTVGLELARPVLAQN